MPTRKKFRRNNRNKNKSRRKRQRGGENVCKDKKICPCPRNKKGSKIKGTNKDCISARTSEQSYLKFILKWMEGKDTADDEFKKWFEKPDEAVILQNFTEKIPADLKIIANSPYVVDEHGVSKDTFHSFFKYENNKWVNKIDEKMGIVNELNGWIQKQLEMKSEIPKEKKPIIKSQFLKQIGLNQLKVDDLKSDDDDLKELKGKKGKVLLDIIENIDFMEKIDETPEYWKELVDPSTKAPNTITVNEGESYLKKWEDMWVEYINSDKLYTNNHDEAFKKDPPGGTPIAKKYKKIHIAAINSIIKQIHLIKSLKLKKKVREGKADKGFIKTTKGHIKDLFKLFEFMFIPFDPKNDETNKKKDEANLETKDVKLNFMMTNTPGNTIWQIKIPERNENGNNIPEQIIAPFDNFLDDIEKAMEEVKWKDIDNWHDFTLNAHTTDEGKTKEPNVSDDVIGKQIDTLGDKSVPEIHNALEFQIIRYLRASILRPSLKLKWCGLEKQKKRAGLNAVRKNAFGLNCDKKGGRKTRRRRRKRKRKKTRRRRRRRR